LFHLKNRLKTRVALIELLDLSWIAVGNVGVPTCLNFKYQFVLQIPICTSNTNLYFKYQFVLQIPIGIQIEVMSAKVDIRAALALRALLAAKNPIFY
jgi:hypothetical protein